MREAQSIRKGTVAGLGAGLWVFLVLESALARHLGPGLLLPFAEGAFLPGRLVRMALCVGLTLALFLTDRGRRIRQQWDRLCTRDRGRWLTAGVMAVLFFLWAMRITVPAYMTIDEVSFLQASARVPKEGLAALRNTLSHSSQENASSISLWLCALVGLFYGLDPHGYWYLGYHLLILTVSVTVTGRCLLVKTCRHGWPAWAGCLLIGFMELSLFLYPYASISFTVTAAAAGTAGVALLLCRQDATGSRGRVVLDALCILLLFLCALQRRASFLCLMCFFALAAVYGILSVRRAPKSVRRRNAVSLCLVCAVLLGAVAGAYISGDRLESDEPYREAEYYRSLIQDYLFDDLTYEQYDRAGAPRTLATLLYGWYFMDERVDTDLFRRLSEVYRSDQTAQAEPFSVRILHTAARLAGELWEDPVMRSQTGLALTLLLLCLVLFIRHGKAYLWQALCALCAAGGALLMLLFLIRDGRFPIRVFLVISLPAVVTILLMALSGPEGSPGNKRPVFAPLLLLLSCAGVVLSLCSALSVPHVTDTATREDVFSDQWAIENYARSHADTLFITDIYDVIFDPLHTPDDYPANRVVWGYCGDTAKPSEERLYSDTFFRDDVRFMNERFSSLSGLLQYLSEKYGPVQASLDCQLSATILVTKISSVTPEEQYTGWYQQNGLTYYFRNGKAVTGEQIIEGKQYTFEPAGAEARLLPLTDGQNVIYTTTAYSLQSAN